MSLQSWFDLRKESQKSWEHHFCDEIVYVPETSAILANRKLVRIPSISLPEIYLKSNAWIELQFVLVGERDAYYVAIIEGVNPQIKGHLDDNAFAVPLNSNHVSAGNVREVNNQLAAIGGDAAMLVDVAKRVQSPKGMSFEGCPSLIRLKRFNLGNGLRTNPSNLLVEPFDVFFGHRQMVENRKLSGRGRRLFATPIRETPNNLIQTGTQIVEGIPERERNRIRNIEKRTLETVSSLLRIYIAPDCVSLRSGEFFEQKIQGVQMHLRPTKFQIGIGQSG